MGERVRLTDTVRVDSTDCVLGLALPEEHLDTERVLLTLTVRVGERVLDPLTVRVRGLTVADLVRGLTVADLVRGLAVTDLVRVTDPVRDLVTVGEREREPVPLLEVVTSESAPLQSSSREMGRDTPRTGKKRASAVSTGTDCVKPLGSPRSLTGAATQNSKRMRRERRAFIFSQGDRWKVVKAGAS